jgi:hypothetical protein
MHFQVSATCTYHIHFLPDNNPPSRDYFNNVYPTLLSKWLSWLFTTTVSSELWNEERENFTLIRLVLDSRSNSALPKFRAKGTTFSPTVLPCSNHDRSEHPSTTQLPPHVCQPQFGFWQILQLPERHRLGKICIIWPASLLNSGLAVSKYPNSWGKIESEKPKQRT